MKRAELRSVLVVAASRDDCQMYAAYLRYHGIHAVEALNTADALASAHRVDAVVTGVCLPGPFDGVELIRRLRQNHVTRNQIIIAVTACAFEEDRQRALAAGCDAYLVKPCLPHTLLAELRRRAGLPAAAASPAHLPLPRKRRDIA